MRGILALTQSDDPAEAVAQLKTAQDTAGNQSARALELRAAITRARLLRTHQRSVDARRLLEPVYRWFTEGFNTTDLRDAKALLDELS